MTTQSELLPTETSRASNQIQQELVQCPELETGVIGLMVSILL